MHIWRDVWPDLSVLLVLIAMVGGLVLTFFLARYENVREERPSRLIP